MIRLSRGRGYGKARNVMSINAGSRFIRHFATACSPVFLQDVMRLCTTYTVVGCTAVWIINGDEKLQTDEFGADIEQLFSRGMNPLLREDLKLLLIHCSDEA